MDIVEKIKGRFYRVFTRKNKENKTEYIIVIGKRKKKFR